MEWFSMLYSQHFWCTAWKHNTSLRFNWGSLIERIQVLHHLRSNKIILANSENVEAMNHLKTYIIFPKSFVCNCRTFHHTSPKQFPDHETHFKHAMVSLPKLRPVIRFQGPDTLKFLQGLVTNDVHMFGEPISEKTAKLPAPNVPVVSALPVYAALLTP